MLETIHESGEGIARVRDTMLPTEGDGPSLVVRVCEGLAGRIELESSFEPVFDYGREPGQLEWVDGERLVAHSASGPKLELVSTIAQQEPAARFVLEPGERAAFVLASDGVAPPRDEAEALLEGALEWWSAWSEDVVYEGPYRDTVVRSAVTMKLLTHDPTGAAVAAPTMSLPEIVGGDANWDYRYTWLRDASLTLYAWYATGRRLEGDPFFDWICARVGDPRVRDSGLKVMYDVDGGSDHEEVLLDALDGYRGSRPVRTGNAACKQVQLDVYGEVLDCFASACAWGRSDKLGLWSHYRVLADWVCDHWHEPDNGVWELRGDKRHYVYSKVMAWVALDRALMAGRKHDLPGDYRRWHSVGEEIRAAVLDRGWSEQLGAFRQAFDDDALDASNLLIPLVGFLPADDPRALSSLARIHSDLGAEEGLVYRFAPDDHAAEATFSVCTFWLVNALTFAGRYEEAVETLERMLARAAPLGLFAEEVAPGTGEQLGNLPQGFVHASAITAVVNLARAAGLGEAPASLDAPSGSAHLVPVDIAGEGERA